MRSAAIAPTAGRPTRDSGPPRPDAPVRTDAVPERPRREARRTPEVRGLARDAVRLLVTTPAGHRHASFRDLPGYLPEGTLLVVNDSATLPASLPADGPDGPFLLNLSTRFADRLWLAEPRWSASQPGPLPVRGGDRFRVAGLTARAVAPLSDRDRLWFVAFDGDVDDAMERAGSPIRYAHLDPPYPGLSAYQTAFARVPGSAEMPSAARPFTGRVIDALRRGGVVLARITLHAGVSSLEIEGGETDLPPEGFRVSEASAAAVNAARADGRLVVAVGTTVVRALESAWDEARGRVRAAAGFTRVFVRPERGVRVVDGLVSGFHEPRASHLRMLQAIAGEAAIADAYGEAAADGYRWHEFGDAHLILPVDVAFDARRLTPGGGGPPSATDPDPDAGGDDGPDVRGADRAAVDRMGAGPALGLTM